MRIDAIKKTNIISLLSLLILLTSCSPKVAQVKPEEMAREISITSIEIGKSDERSVLTILTTDSLQGNYTVIKMSDPPRVVVEMPGVNAGNFEGEINAEDGVISKVTTSRGEVSGTHIEIDLLSSAEHEVLADGNKIDIVLTGAEKPLEEAAEPPATVVEEPKIEEVAVLPQRALKITGIDIKKEGKFTRADIVTDGEITDYNVFELKSPSRVVVDVRNARGITADKDIKTVLPYIKGARLGRHDGQVRIVFDIKGTVKPYEITKGNNVLTILFGKRPTMVEAKVEKSSLEEVSPKIEEKAEPPAAMVEETKEVKGTDSRKKYLTLKAVEIKQDGKFTKVEIITDGKLNNYKVFDLTNPNRVVVDIEGARGIAVKNNIKSDSIYIKGARIGRHNGQVRVVFDYIGNIEPYLVSKGDDRLSILFGNESASGEELEKGKTEAASETPKMAEKVEEAPEVKPELAADSKEEAAAVVEAKAEEKSEVKPELIATDTSKEEAAAVAEAKAEEKSEVKPELAADSKEEAAAVAEAKAEEKSEVKPELAADSKEEAAAVAEAKAEEKTAAQPKIKQEEAQQKTDENNGDDGLTKVYKGQKVTLEFKDADIKNIFRIIAEVSGYNMIIDSAVSGKITIRLVNVPWDQALDILLETNNLGMKKVGNVIRVLPAALVKKEEEDKLAGKKAQEKLEDLVTKLIPVSYASASDLSSKMKDVMSDRGTAQVDERTNTIILKDIKKSIDEAVKLVRDLDTPTPQIMIEARIIEANTSFSRSLGVQWGTGYAADAAHGNPTGYYFPNSYSLTAAGGGVSGAINPAIGQTGGNVGISFGSINNTLNLDLRLQALEAQSQGKIISSPKIITLDNKEASIQQGVSIPFETTSSSGTQTVFIDANLNLTVTPHVTADGKISMKVKASNNSPSTIQGASGAPGIDKKEANTEILVKDGDTTVIGGIYTIQKRESETFTPFLGRIPVIGWLFKSKDKDETKTELLIFITPRIIRDTPA